MRKMIGNTTMRDDLYCFDERSFINKNAQYLSGVSSNSAYKQVMFWHYWLGHPSFPYLKHLFPASFKGLDCSSFQFEDCYLLKSQRSTYASKPYHCSKPFYLIHSDVWWPSKVKTVFKKMAFEIHWRSYMVMLDLFDTQEIWSGKLLKEFYNMIENQLHKKISIACSDDGTECFDVF